MTFVGSAFVLIKDLFGKDSCALLRKYRYFLLFNMLVKWEELPDIVEKELVEWTIINSYILFGNNSDLFIFLLLL